MSLADPVYLELVDFIASGNSPEALVAFKPSAAVQERVNFLIERQRHSGLSADETAELDDFLQLEHILIMAKARARHKLGLAGQ
jgi:hypothetical protein